MNEKIAVIAIIIDNINSVDKINSILHDFGDHIIGRMGIPYKKKEVNVISIVMDAPIEIINSLSGKLGMIDGVSSKVLTAK